MSHHPIDNRARGTVYRVTSTVLRLCSVLVSALALSIVIEWLGMTFIWAEQGAEKSRQMVATEIGYLNRYRELNPVMGRLDEPVLDAVVMIRTWLIDHGLGFLAHHFAVIGEYIDATLNIIVVFCLRLAVMVFSMPVYVFFACVGATRGLVNRELRKWGGGRESSGLFHLFMRLVPMGFVGSWVVYLTWPWSINPNVVVLPFAMFFGGTIMAMTYRYKKYL
ncbi:hypothetical protein AB833_21485 [Chromatiales bacterium (ex Bugula neritina AB1)]|nr:hypothetical protein AB833_21485 [Chromatiales bacterium (ex Bugula neritina AB1)]